MRESYGARKIPGVTWDRADRKIRQKFVDQYNLPTETTSKLFGRIMNKSVKNTIIDYFDEFLKMNESLNIHYPSLKKLVNMEYTDPRTKDGCTIVAEKCGKLKKENGDICEGSYIMYEDSDMKGKFIAVHVSDTINEESGQPDINVIAIGSKKSVRERMGYRIRRNKNLKESKELSLNRKLNEKNDSKAISSIFDDPQWKRMIGFSVLPKEKQKELMDDFKKYKANKK